MDETEKEALFLDAFRDYIRYYGSSLFRMGNRLITSRRK